MRVEVAYATPERQLILSIEVAEDCTVEQAVALSGILKHFSEIDLTKNKVGIFSQICPLTKLLQGNDRVEIYRDLVFNPMEARRQRAIQQGR
ncbi:MAG: RnfH family protein [Methyloprofundus sp.]|nr:RnfH family protein [Methyloprofundus sp.]MDT8424984.1 RnfH family protein [Methyloprofundus sp.]